MLKSFMVKSGSYIGSSGTLGSQMHKNNLNIVFFKKKIL